MSDINAKYKGGQLTEIVIGAIAPFMEKIKSIGIKKSIENLIPGTNADKFVLEKIKYQLCKRRGIELAGGLGRADVQYRRDGIQIEFCGIIRLFIKKITITDKQIIKSFDSIIAQIEKKYISNDNYITDKIDSIIYSLSVTEIYKPKTSEEKTLYDLAMLILLNYYKSSDDVPKWIEPALANIGKGEFIIKWIDILADYISEVIAQVSEGIFFDFKVTFDSALIRMFLNKKTNRGQISHLLGMFDINVKDVIYNFAKNYVSPSFIRGASEILRDIAGNFLGNCFKSFEKNLKGFKENIPDGPFNITVSFGQDVFSERNFRWFTRSDIKNTVFEYSYSKDFSQSIKREVVCKRVPKTWPLLNLGLISGYEAVYLSEYSISIKNLAPGIVYYRILYSQEKKSSTYCIDIKDSQKEFEFMILADSQGMVKSDYEIFSKMLNSASEKEKNTDFIIHLGDFVDDGNNEEYWKWVLESEVWRKKVAVALSGNHEARISATATKAGVSGAIFGHFNLANLPPQNTKTGVYYSFVYNNATFIVLNTNGMSESGLDKEQYRWALDVAKNAKTKWKILCVHKAPYSNGPHHKDSDVKKIKSQIVDLAYYGEIDIVLGGHDHVYVRTPFMVESKSVKCDVKIQKIKNHKKTIFLNPRGTIFIVPSTSGVKHYNGDISADFPVCKSLKIVNPVYSKIKINDDELSFSAYEFERESGDFSEIDSFSVSKKDISEKTFDGKFVSEYINIIPDIPKINNSKIIDKIGILYNKLEYSEKLKVTNYDRFLHAIRMNESYKKIQSAQIRIVRSRNEFMAAVSDPSVGTIITDCSEIKFENCFSLNDKVYIDRNLCITGEAKLSHVRFVLKEGVFCIVSGSVCIDNTRKPFSVYTARDIFEMHDNSVLVIENNATLNNGYGTGLHGHAVNISGENVCIYLSSSGHNFVSKGFVTSSEKTSKVSICSGKYLSSGGFCTFSVNGALNVSGGFVRSVRGYEKSQISMTGGIIGEENELRYPIPIESFGKINICGGTVKSREGVSIYIHGKDNMDNSNFNDSIDIAGKILYN